MVGYTFLYNAGVRKMKDMMAPSSSASLLSARDAHEPGPIRQDVNAVVGPRAARHRDLQLPARRQPLWASAIGTRVLQTNREDIAFATLGYRNESSATST
jgi:hypothetical protein